MERWYRPLTVGLLVLAVAALGGCGSTATSHPVASGSPASPQAVASPSATPGRTALDPAAQVGKTLFGLDDSTAACQAALDGRPPPMLPAASGSGPGDSTAADTGNAIAAGTGTLVPGGLLLLPCAPDQASAASAIIAFNLFTRAVAWQFPLGGYDSYQVGSQHLFLISHTTAPPTGLKSASTTYTLTAVNLRNGSTSWSVPYFADNPGADDNGISALTEGPSGFPGHPQSVVITYLGTSAYDAGTGMNLWHIPTEYLSPASGSYALDGIVEVYGYQDNYYDSHITGFTARTDKKVWDLRLRSACAGGTGPEDDVFAGLVEWEFSDSCLFAHNVATGQLVAENIYPSSWQSVAATPDALLEYNGSRLSYFTMTDLAHPVWSQPAGPTTPLAMSAGHVLVNAPSGLLVLSTANGSITSSVPATLFSGDGSYTVVDGLVAQGSEAGDTSVLELDPPAVG